MDEERSGRIRGTSHGEEERAFLQQRLALFWKALFLVAVATDVLEVAMRPASSLQPSALLDRASTLTFGLLWLLCRGGPRPWGALLAVEWAGLAVAVAEITLAGRYLTAEAIAHFAVQDPATAPGSLALAKAADAYVSIMTLLAGALIVVIRAAIVPSPPARTLLLTAALGIPFVAVPWFLAPALAGAPPPRTANFPVVGAVAYAIWWSIVTVGATVVSSVVFGLRAEVRRARRLGSSGRSG